MTKYYYIGTYLPSLSFESQPEITFARLEELYRSNLTETDYEKTKTLRLFYDILNLRALWLGEEQDSFGIMTPLEIDESLISHTGFPLYVFEYLEANPHKENRVRNFPFLLAKFFQSAQEVKDPFLRDYLNFERELRLILTAFRAKKLNRDLNTEFQYEDPEEELVAQLLAFKDAKNFELPEKYKEIKQLFDKYGDEPLALQKAIDEYRFATIDSFVDLSDTFSIERMLAYMAQLMIVQKWFELDKVKGSQIVETIVKEIA